MLEIKIISYLLSNWSIFNCQLNTLMNFQRIFAQPTKNTLRVHKQRASHKTVRTETPSSPARDTTKTRVKRDVCVRRITTETKLENVSLTRSVEVRLGIIWIVGLALETGKLKDTDV